MATGACHDLAIAPYQGKGTGEAGPAEIAAARIDVGAWLRSLGRKKSRIAKTLAKGERTKTVARMFGLSEGRISQLRTELRDSWDGFQGGLVAA